MSGPEAEMIANALGYRYERRMAERIRQGSSIGGRIFKSGEQGDKDLMRRVGKEDFIMGMKRGRKP